MYIDMVRAVITQMFHHNTLKNADGTCQRWRRNGKTKLWKTRPEEFIVPVKQGMYNYGRIHLRNCANYHDERDCPHQP